MDVATVDDLTRPGPPDDPRGTTSEPQPDERGLEGTWRILAVAGVVVVVAAGIVLRFWTRSALWLDEALTVDIAKRPLSQLHQLLRQDGAPPLYYVLLHFWMKVFGTSNLGVRSLSGVISVITLPVAWLAGRTYGRQSAWCVALLVASAPFAIYYGTEVRMYSLVMLLTALGFLALVRAMRKPRPGNLIAVAVVAAALLYSQYWALYLLASVGLWLLWQVRPGQPDTARRTNARWTFGALVVAGLLFVPWLPTFVFQSRHTGTPWAAPGNFGAIVSALTGFTDNQATLSAVGSNQGRLLAILYLLFAFLAVFGVARDRWHIELDLHTRPRTRAIGFVVFVTLVLAVGGGLISKSGYSNRYASVIFIPFIVLVVLGAMTLGDPRARAVAFAVAALAGLAVGVQNINTQRTQAPGVAAVLAAHAQRGDVVAFCPDQLGPAVYRLTSTSGYREITYPRSTGPAIIDWVDYKATVQSHKTAPFVAELEAMAGTGHSIWLVYASGYQGYRLRCEDIAEELVGAPGYVARNWITQNPAKYYEPMDLIEYTKSPSTTSGPTAGS